ncbi:hypothetical protein GO491_05850 [Flavobacteriaceae bacterium Ap0902]|nr:hypothetical protein [Flavobacteriaceae bacterium Ap0902]
MLTELINFTNSLSDDFKSLGMQPKEGLHILLKVDDNGLVQTKTDTIAFDFYSKKIKGSVSPTLQKSLMLQENAWCVNTNKCYDLPTKAIHTCSPFSIAFKREHLEGGKKFEINQEREKLQIQERFKDYYFEKAKETIDTENDFQVNAFQSFADLFINGGWSVILNNILNQRSIKLGILSNKESERNEAYKNEKDKIRKDALKDAINDLKEEIIKYQPLSESDYILFYLDIPLDYYKEVHGKYLNDKLFNTSDYNTKPNEEGIVYGTNDFQNGYNSNMPFLLHQTATFDITGRISNLDARALYDFSKVLPSRILPNPLPIFIYNEEFKEKVIALYKKDKRNFRDIIDTLYQNHENDFQNYYLLNWSNTRDGVVFNDFDFVSKFEYKVNGNEGLETLNLFHIQARKEDKQKGEKHYAIIHNIFELEDRVLKYLIQNKYHRVDYFSDFKKEDYENRDLTFLSYTKYRKAVYDYVYKSNRYAITRDIFKEMIFNSILDDIKNDNEYGIKEKLNIWYSLYDYFYKIKNQKTPPMASELKNYEKFVTDIINESADLDKATDKHFAFSAGQIIYYLLTKSKAQDNGLKLIEPYLQKTNVKALQQNITEDFKRYSHESFSDNFKKVSAFVLSYETDINLKELQPQLLSGLFAKNQIYSTKNNQENK